MNIKDRIVDFRRVKPSEVRQSEEWRAVIGTGAYEVSSWGRIRRIGAARGATPGRIRHATRGPDGYLRVSLSDHGGRIDATVHALVATAFLGPRPSGHEVNHIDSDKGNNHVANLEYVTRSANLLHRVQLGIGRGERNGAARITADVARAIRRDHTAGMGYKRLAQRYGVTWAIARGVASGKTWAHVDS